MVIFFDFFVDETFFLFYNIIQVETKRLKMDRENLKILPRMLCFLSVILMCNFHPAANLNSGSKMQERIKFERITIEHGLSQNTVYCILQDSRGFLWLGTENGLDRYDGYGFKSYESKPGDAGSLSGSTVRTMCEDRSGTLWIGTSHGLNRFDRLNETFTRFKNNPQKSGSLSHDHILSILEDNRGELWIGTLKGLNKYDKEKGTFHHWFHNPKDPLSLSGDRITVIFQDSTSELWIGTDKGLCRFHRKKRIFNRYPVNPGDTAGNQVNAVCKGQPGVLWVGIEGGGLSRFDLKKKNFTAHYRCKPGGPGRLSSNKVQVILLDRKSKTLWIGTGGGGLNQFDPGTGTFLHYEEDPAIATSLSNNTVYSIYEDDAGIIWVGTEGGLNKLDKRKNEFRHWAVEPGKRNSLDYNYVWAIFEDKPGMLWIGTNKGLNKFDRKSGTFTHYTHDPGNPGTLGDGRITSIYEDHGGVLWVGTNKGVLNKFNRETETFSRYRLSDSRINSILEGRPGILWVGTNVGLCKFAGDKGTFDFYRNNSSAPDSLSHDRVSCIFEDRTGVLWVGTRDGGLNRFDRQWEKFACYKHNPSEPASLSSNNVSTIYEDNRGTLWVGTYHGGLNKLADRRRGIFKSYRKKEQNGLPDDTVFGILEDNSGNLWLSTYNGLSKFDPGEETFKNYDVRDGLQSNEFNGGACFKSPDGEMFFGGTNGFNAFYPNRITLNKHKPRVVITGFRVFDKPFPEQSVTEMKEIVLSYEQSVFSFEFAVLDFTTPGKNRFSYKMEDVDPDWVQGDASKRFATYTKLSPGSYVFHLMGSNNDGIRSEKETSIRIIITPPFVKTWWFKIALAFGIMFILFIGYRRRTKILRKKLSEQERVRKILEQSHDEMERARDLAEIRHAENEKLLTAISAIFIAVDSNGFIFQWNKPAEKFFGIPREKAAKHLFVNVLKDYIGKDKLNEIFKKGLKQDKSSKEIEISVGLNPGANGIKLLLSSVSPIMDRAGKKLGFILLAKDITNKKEEEMRQHLSRRLESLGQMASGIAHEIKTPLQYIAHNARFVTDSFKGVIQLYKMVNETLAGIRQPDHPEPAAKMKELIADYDVEYIMEEIPKASDQIANGVNKVSEIVNAMNTFSHPGTGCKEKSDINRLLKTTLVMAQNRIKKNADIHLNLFEELPRVPCYPGELNQVFLNILVNAVDAIVETGKWGLIKVSTYLEGNEAVISISDTGAGIPESHRENIFNPFFTTKEVGKGTGQGLSLAHNVIIEKHKGKLDFVTKKGEGTTFIIRLPLAIEGEQ